MKRLLLILVFGSLCAFAEDQAAVSGRVEDLSGVGISRARLLLVDIHTLEAWRTDPSPDGTFVFTNVRAGDYEIRAASELSCHTARS